MKANGDDAISTTADMKEIHEHLQFVAEEVLFCRSAFKRGVGRKMRAKVIQSVIFVERNCRVIPDGEKETVSSLLERVKHELSASSGQLGPHGVKESVS